MAGLRIPYTFGALDRAAHRRKDAAWVAARLADPASRFLAVWRNRSHVLDGDPPQPALLYGERASMALELAEEIVFLGCHGAHALFALNLSPLDESEVVEAVGRQGRFADLREVGPQLSREDGALLAYARAMVFWHGRHLFCGRCGAPTETKDAGHARICTGPDCGLQQFPRTDPAVIMLVHDGGDLCVLGHNPRMPPGMHSTLAGFVEPGESIEEAVIREVAEEVGLRVPPEGLVYLGSQPWPFPSSLMLGFHARAEPAELMVDPEELAAARWYHREELIHSPEDESFRLPRRDSIAYALIRAWLDESA